MTSHTQFFSCDWGTSSFRLRRVRVSNGQVLHEIREPTGIRDLFSDIPNASREARDERFGSFLRDRLIVAMDPAAEIGSPIPPVLLSGMASSSVGWRELAYADVPFSLDGSSTRLAVLPLRVTAESSTQVHLISGVATESEMMRGEETEILGLFAQGAHQGIAENGLVLLPGTHSKQVRLQQRQIVDFRTFMTGELYDLLAQHSLLRVSVQTPPKQAIDLTHADARAAFLEGVVRVMERGLAGSLFQVRTRGVLGGLPPSLNRWFLSGLLIGAEIADLARSAADCLLLLAAPPATSLAYALACQYHALSDRLTVVPPETVASASIAGHQWLLQRALLDSTPPSTP